MSFGLLAGLAAALAWGSVDVVSALASRRVGSLVVTVGVVAVTTAVLSLVGLATGATFPTQPATYATCAVLGLIGMGAFLAYFTALRVGPISVVSGMVAAYGGLTVVLSVLFRGETLTPAQAFGAAVATGGVILTGVAFEGGLRGTRLAGPGVALGLLAMTLAALMAITTDIALESATWLQVLLVSRLVMAATCVAIVAVVLRWPARLIDRPLGPTPDAPPFRRDRVVAAVVAAGVLDVLGLISFAIGLERAPTWLVGLASSFGPAVTILAAVALLGERLKPVQWFGLSGIAVGLVAIALP